MTSTHDMRIPDAICFSHQNIVPSWGFVIFRCTYASQSQWDKIQSHVKQQTLKRLNRKGHEQLRNNLTWTVIEDASTLDGAEWHAPYDFFTKRVQDEVEGAANADEHRRGVEYWRQSIWGIPRYEYYIFVDKESLDSVINALGLEAENKNAPKQSSSTLDESDSTYTYTYNNNTWYQSREVDTPPPDLTSLTPFLKIVYTPSIKCMRGEEAAKTARQARKAAGTQEPRDEQDSEYDDWIDDEDEIEEMRLERWQRCRVYDLVNVYAALTDSWEGTWTRSFSTDEFGVIESSYSNCWDSERGGKEEPFDVDVYWKNN